MTMATAAQPPRTSTYAVPATGVVARAKPPAHSMPVTIVASTSRCASLAPGNSTTVAIPHSAASTAA